MNTHLHILHLERRKDRLDVLHEQLEEQNISFYSIIEAIDDKENVKKAITIGHKRIVQSAKNNGLPNCIIAEDDISFTARGAWRYFLSQIPADYDMFCGLVYSGNVDEDNVLKTGGSGIMTLYSIHSRYYDFFLSQDDNIHIDRNLGQYAFGSKIIICNPYVCMQTGGYSDNLKRNMWYDVYLEGKKLYGCD